MPRYRRVTYQDRCQIKAFLSINLALSEIAQRLGFHKSTICRELTRNQSDRIYSVDRAEMFARARRRSCRRTTLLQGEFKADVTNKILQGWSPEQISGRFALEGKRKISHETIYKLIRFESNEKPLYLSGLRRFGKKGCGRIRQRKYRSAYHLSIHDRPKSAIERSRLGHWERDLMHLQKKRVLVCVERRSRYVKIARAHEPIGVHLTHQTKNLLRNARLPFRSFTNDNGPEFFDSEQFKEPIYYCDPHSPQQRGTIENTIGIIRQYLSKKLNLDAFTDQTIQGIENLLNHRPRKCLGYKTPFEVMFKRRVALAS